MKKSIVLSGVLTLALAVSTTGCGIFETDKTDRGSAAPYYRDLAQQDTDSKAGEKNPASDADLHNTGNNDGPVGSNQVGELGDGSGLSNTYDGFGIPIADVAFDPIYFGFDQFAISAAENSKINDVVAYLNKNPEHGVVIEGNCDARGTEEYNRALGERRALAAQEQLLAAGIAANRIKTVSNGKSKLAAQGSNEDAHRLNRRDEFIAVKLLKK
ncbi:MAG: OmpA family protein [Lentisphaeria bacterium]|nr:OmpA family protein [Lentisphaeria bacterium]